MSPTNKSRSLTLPAPQLQLATFKENRLIDLGTKGNISFQLHNGRDPAAVEHHWHHVAQFVHRVGDSIAPLKAIAGGLDWVFAYRQTVRENRQAVVDLVEGLVDTLRMALGGVVLLINVATLCANLSITRTKTLRNRQLQQIAHSIEDLKILYRQLALLHENLLKAHAAASQTAKSRKERKRKGIDQGLASAANLARNVLQPIQQNLSRPQKHRRDEGAEIFDESGPLRGLCEELSVMHDRAVVLSGQTVKHHYLHPVSIGQELSYSHQKLARSISLFQARMALISLALQIVQAEEQRIVAEENNQMLRDLHATHRHETKQSWGNRAKGWLANLSS